MIAHRYTLVREIGRGGMGTVWLARDEVLGREVALKRVGRAPGSPAGEEVGAMAQAEQEARLAARLNHPHVVAVFDLVVDHDTEDRWLVMEHVGGGTLAQLVEREGALPVDDAAALLRQVADGLAAAHAVGIVHRDVKPSNILLDDGVVKLTDFGIARLLDDASTTRTGLVKGSPAYLAPEVASGSRGSEASDVWSLGATAWYVLAGRPPYTMDGDVLGGLYRIVHEDPPRLPDAGWLTALLDATMVKDPARRWTAPQVRDFLGRRDTAPGSVEAAGTRTLPSPAAAGTSQGAAQRPGSVGRSRRAWLVAALALVVLTGVALAVGLRHGSGDGSSARDPAPSRTASPSASPASPSPSPSTTPSASPSASPDPAPTAAGMRAFVREYVTAVAADPDRAWTMLTPAFQRQSGGLATYRRFWSGVGAAHLLSVQADPERLVVSYRVRFDNFGTGKRPTVLRLERRGGRYLVAGESTS